jgi:1-acyl-sn-glycerol-3-phosphate acyltransferase
VTLTERIVNAFIKRVTRILCRIDDAQLRRVPKGGPLILVTNHVNFVDVPLVYTHLQPRPVIGLAKVESWESPALGWLLDLWDSIPLRRGEADVEALRRGLAVLQAGQILVVAPEGTRSGDGRLQRGHPGVVLLALRSGAPLLPLAFYGAEDYKRNLARLRRTDFHIVVGQPFVLDSAGVRVTHDVRQLMTDEIMYRIAALLPASYRGHYSDVSAATTNYLRISPGPA